MDPKLDRIIDPDICILFSRYMEAGKTINVYDWFESFSQGIDYSHLNLGPKQRRKSKAKAGSKAAQQEEEEERKREEVQRRDAYGRFMWSLHELDMLGLLRWSGRGTGKKGAECAGKVVWVTPE
jgi:origin recognition complex subunit 3